MFAYHSAEVERIAPTRFVLRQTGAPHLADQVKDLMDRQSSCCSFLTFIVATYGPADDMGRVGSSSRCPSP